MAATRREIAKVGTWKGVTVTEQDLKEAVETFVDKAPTTVGHPKSDSFPRLGKIYQPLYDKETNTLTAFVEPNELLADYEAKGFYDEWSIGLKTDENGKKYIHHLAMLGESPAKIKGMKILESLDFTPAMITASDSNGYIFWSLFLAYL